jgi:nucleolar complex protein 2
MGKKTQSKAVKAIEKGPKPGIKTQNPVKAVEKGPKQGKKTQNPVENKNNDSSSKLKSKSLDDFLQDWSADDENNSGSESEAETDDFVDSENEFEAENGEKSDSEGEDDADRGSEGSEGSEDEAEGSGDEAEGSGDEAEGSGVGKQKKYLANLQEKDPEFYKFLAENDEELLNFDESDSDDDDDDDQLDPIHQIPENLEVASDDSEYEDEEDDLNKENSTKKSNKITKSMIDEWSKRLDSAPSVNLITDLILAFKAAVASIGSIHDNNEDPKEAPGSKNNKKGNKKAAAAPIVSKYKVTSGSIFNALTKLCLTKLEPALAKVMKINFSTKKNVDPTKSKSWRPLNKWLKSYTGDLAKILSSLSEPSVISALLKHIHGLVAYYTHLPKSCKVLLKTLIRLWSTHTEESVRVLTFMVMIKLTRSSMSSGADHQGSILEMAIKQMYMSYIRNAKFTSPNTWPMIHFMRRSLAEVFLLDPALAYKYAFIYIRQLTIHLRNAIMHTTNGTDAKKKESPIQTVYNWQFVHSIHLWVQLLGDSTVEVLEPLVYPLVQLITGTIRLNYTSKHYPLRFHLAKLLNQLSLSTGKFIPILPYYLDILNGQNFGKKSTKLTMKPMDLSCVLRLSKSQLAENGFRDATIEHVYCGLMEVLASNSHKICFPELAVPASAQIRNFVKKCKVGNYTKKMKGVVDKINDNTKFIQDRRAKVSFGVRDLDQIRIFEAQLKNQGTPLGKYYETFKTVKEAEMLKKKQKELDDYKHIKEIKPKKGKTSSDEDEEFPGIFGDSDLEDDLDDKERFELKEERGKKRKIEEKIVQEKSVKTKKAQKVEEKAESSEEDEADEVNDFDNFSD